MKRYQVYRNECIFNNLFMKKGGAASADAQSFAGLDLTNLFTAFTDSSSESDNSEGDFVLDNDAALSKLPLRTQSAPSSFPSLSSPPVIKRTLSAESRPQAVGTKLVKGYGETEGEININLAKIIEKIVKVDVQVNIIPVISDGSCGLSSIITLLQKRVPSSREVYEVREKLDVDIAPLSEVLITECHGENLEASYLINYVKEHLKINLCVIHEQIIMLPTDLNGENLMFMVGDGSHYNPIEINNQSSIPSFDTFYQAILAAPKVKNKEISFIFQ